MPLYAHNVQMRCFLLAAADRDQCKITANKKRLATSIAAPTTFLNNI